MHSSPLVGRRLLAIFALPMFLSGAAANAQISEVTVGITPTCPYGLEACWAGAYEALTRIAEVESVSKVPDVYNCTAAIRLKGASLPDPSQWGKEFKSSVGQVYVFRGVEVTLEGSLHAENGQLFVSVPGVEKAVPLAPLEHKLQWNLRKGSARQPEPDEHNAYCQLAAIIQEAERVKTDAVLIGPLQNHDNGVSLEIREFYLNQARE